MAKKGQIMEEPKRSHSPAPGRPEGSVASKAPPTKEVKAVCRKAGCGSSDLERGHVLNDMEHYQPHEGGPATTRRRWQRAQCRKCRSWQVVITDYNP